MYAKIYCGNIKLIYFITAPVRDYFDEELSKTISLNHKISAVSPARRLSHRKISSIQLARKNISNQLSWIFWCPLLN
jgi:hypothetical protein